jgi:NADH:ubiquinone oxidoreductase subunit 4 (subunit M)
VALGVTFLPSPAASCCWCCRRARGAFRWWALVVTLATFGLSLGMLARSTPAGRLPARRAGLLGGVLALRYVLGIDGISVFMVCSPRS